MKQQPLWIILGVILLAEQPRTLGEPVTVKQISDSVRVSQNTAVVANQVVASESLAERIVDTNIVIPKLDFAAVPLFEALTAISRAHNLSFFIDSSVTGSITVRLNNVTLNDALQFIIKEHKLAWERTGGIVKVFRPVPPPSTPKPLDITFENGLLSVDLSGADIQQVVRKVTALSGKNTILQGNVQGTITGKLSNIKLEKGLGALLTSNGFTLSKIDDLMYVGMVAEGQSGSQGARTLDVRCDSGMVSVDVTNGPLAYILAEINRQCGVSMFLQSAPEGTVSVAFSDKTVEESLTYLLLTSAYTFREINGIYFIGKRDAENLSDSRLIRLKHLIASSVEPLVPASLGKQVSVKTIKEHNGLLITGPRTAIAEVESFINEIDIPMAQVLFEVLVVDYTSTDRAEFGIAANNFGKDTLGEIYYPNVDLSANGKELNEDLRSMERHLGISNLGTLPANFFIRLEAMQRQGKANIRSHPKIASLNGHSASINIGTTQYYLLKSTTIYPSQQSSLSTQTSERFEKIEADMSLDVTPYVNKSGELIVEVKPEFNTPAQAFDSKVPPTINHRVLNSTVRLKNGETIVLGGLVQSTKSVAIDKFPILGSIPLIGRLFQNRSSTDQKSEMSIYLTPYVYYGSEGSVDLDSIFKK